MKQGTLARTGLYCVKFSVLLIFVFVFFFFLGCVWNCLFALSNDRSLIISQINVANQTKQDIFNSGNIIDSFRPSKRQKMATEGDFEQGGGEGEEEQGEGVKAEVEGAVN